MVKPKYIHQKICVIGASGVGKCSLVKSSNVSNQFDKAYLDNIGAFIVNKNVTVPLEHQLLYVTLIAWDLTAAKIFKTSDNLRNNYYRGTEGAIVVADMSNPKSIINMRQWADSIWDTCGHIPVSFVGTNIDSVLPKEGLENLCFPLKLTDKNIPPSFAEIKQDRTNLANLCRGVMLTAKDYNYDNDLASSYITYTPESYRSENPAPSQCTPNLAPPNNSSIFEDLAQRMVAICYASKSD